LFVHRVIRVWYCECVFKLYRRTHQTFSDNPRCCRSAGVKQSTVLLTTDHQLRTIQQFKLQLKTCPVGRYLTTTHRSCLFSPKDPFTPSASTR